MFVFACLFDFFTRVAVFLFRCVDQCTGFSNGKTRLEKKGKTMSGVDAACLVVLAEDDLAGVPRLNDISGLEPTLQLASAVAEGDIPGWFFVAVCLTIRVGEKRFHTPSLCRRRGDQDGRRGRTAAEPQRVCGNIHAAEPPCSCHGRRLGVEDGARVGPGLSKVQLNNERQIYAFQLTGGRLAQCPLSSRKFWHRTGECAAEAVCLSVCLACVLACLLACLLALLACLLAESLGSDELNNPIRTLHATGARNRHAPTARRHGPHFFHDAERVSRLVRTLLPSSSLEC